MTDDQQPTADDHEAEHQRLHDVITERYTAARDYVNTLETPALLGELRCLSTALQSQLKATGLTYSTLGVTCKVLVEGLSRFDAGSPAPVPEAVEATDCGCADEDTAGALTRVKELGELIDEVEAHHNQHPDRHTAGPIARMAEALEALIADGTIAGGAVIELGTLRPDPNLN